MKLADYIDKTSEELEKMTTPQLLALRNVCYRSRKPTCGCYYGDCNVDKEAMAHNASMGPLLTKILAILPTREHYPNKLERKAARQARAKRSR